MEILAQQNDEDEEEIKYSLLNYLKDVQQQPKKTHIQRQVKRTRSSITDVTLLKPILSNEQKQNDGLQCLEQACLVIQNFLQQQKDNQLNNPKAHELVEGLKQQINQQYNNNNNNNNNNSSPSQRLIPIQNDYIPTIEPDLLEAYKKIKFQFSNYMKSHFLLMDENVSYKIIFGLLKEQTKNLLNCDNFSYVIIQQQLEIYQTVTDSTDTLVLTELIKNELETYPQDMIFQFPKNSILCSHLKNNDYNLSYCFLTNETLFIYHLRPNDEGSILKIVNDYQLIDEIKSLSVFLLQTIQNAKVQFFSPLSIADMILDIGIAFVRASKFLIIEYMYNILNTIYKIDKLYTDQPDISIWEQDVVYIVFKDIQVTVCFRIYQMNLNQQNDQKIHSEIKQYYEKYLRFIRECFDKSAFYKFFLRSNDSLFFEFDKSGHLVFISRPIPPQIKNTFNIKFNSHMIQTNLLSYNKIFDQEIVSDIENYLQDQKWKMRKENSQQQYEIFLKIEEKTYKGFAVIFTENIKGWVKEQMQTLDSWDNKIKAKIRKQLIQHETLNFVHKLEENNPEMRDTVAALYMPLNQISRKTKIIHMQSEPKKLEIPQRSRFSSQQDINLNQFCLKECDDKIDTYDFNILELTSQIEKHKIVWAIFKKNGQLEDYQIPSDNLSSFIKEMEHHYNINNNPYHNYDHGVTVMQTSHYFCIELSQTQNQFIIDSFTKFILIVSSFGHDVGHTGKTNMFEINSLSDLAIRYHDKSVLEQHHAALTIEILKQPQNNILINLNQDQYRNFRKGLINNILSTDMSEHFTLLKDFENRSKDFSDTKILSSYLMHLSDFGGTGKKTPISIQWSSRVNLEFSIQYKLEGELGYPQQPYMKDLNIPQIMAKSEISFLKVIVRPCYVLMSEFLEDRLKHCIQNIDETIQYWEKISKKDQEL